MKQRILWCFTISYLLLSVSAVPALAAERIDMVSISIDDAGTLTAGEPIGELSVSSDSSEYYITNAVFLNDHDIWQRNERPRVRIELYAEDDYKFSYTSKSHFSLDGYGAVFSSADIMDSGTYMELNLYLERVTGDYVSSDDDFDLTWEDNTASWENLYGTETCEVRLYRWNSSGTGSSVVTTKQTDAGEYDFTSYMTKSGNYSFRVRPIDSVFNSSELWSDHSPKHYINQEDARDNQEESDFSSGNTYGGPGHENDGQAFYPGSAESLYQDFGPGSTADGQWLHNESGWWYQYTHGSWPFSSWQRINGQWFYFNDQGYMQTGWIYTQGNWYYALPDGVMAAGWQKIGPYWYYLTNTGIMATGWNLIDGFWYYLDPVSGAMWAGQTTPDGHYVNANGIRLY